ncbi:serine hydrolase [Polynucleobacter meluiroseus]|nr:serine hydrolase [Polynucleobacter meluiroseus]
MRLNRFLSAAGVSLWMVGVTWTVAVASTDQSTQATNSSKSAKSAKSVRASKDNVASAAKPATASAKTSLKIVKTSKKSQKSVRTSVTRSTQVAVATAPSLATALGLRGQNDQLSLKSSVVMVVNQDTKEVYYEKNSAVSLPIASITKLMTAMVVLDSKLPMDEAVEINADDVHIYHTSRLARGTVLTREEALLLALMSSENRAAYTLGRNYPGGIPAFVEAMNRKAKEIGMNHSHFADPTGLLSENVASAEDLTRMLNAAYQYKMIREFSTWPTLTMVINQRPQIFLNTNRLVRAGDMNIGLQKTGFINAAGRCLVMQARVNNTPLLLVFLDSVGTQSRFADAVRVKDWYERSGELQPIRRLM